MANCTTSLHGARAALALPHWTVAAEVIAGTELILTVARRSLDEVKWQRQLRCFEPSLSIRAFAFQQAWHERREGDAAHCWLRGQVLRACG